MAATITTGALAGAVRALRDAPTRTAVLAIQHDFEPGDPAEAALLADVATLALARIDAADEARRDVLTGALNLRGFYDAAHGRLAACPGPVAVALADVDGLKAINDRHGHVVGSRVLRTAADALVAAFPGAVVGRLGGDEFGVLIPDRSDAGMLERRLGAAVRAQRPDVATLSLSAGFATGIAVGPEDLATLLEAADVDLYRQRRTRRRNDRGRFDRGPRPWTPRVFERVAS